MLVVLIFLFAGDPDPYDAIREYIMNLPISKVPQPRPLLY